MIKGDDICIHQKYASMDTQKEQRQKKKNEKQRERCER